MSKAGKLYDHSPELARDEDGKVSVKKPEKGNETKGSPKEGQAQEHIVRHVNERREMKHRHMKEHLDMHHKHEMEHGAEGDKKEMAGRHHEELKIMHTRHEKEMKEMSGRQEGKTGGDKIEKTEENKKE